MSGPIERRRERLPRPPAETLRDLQVTFQHVAVALLTVSDGDLSAAERAVLSRVRDGCPRRSEDRAILSLARNVLSDMSAIWPNLRDLRAKSSAG